MSFHFLLALPVHMSYPLIVSWVRVAQSLVFCVALGISFVLFLFFLRPLHCLSCLFTASDYPIGYLQTFNKYDAEKLNMCIYENLQWTLSWIVLVIIWLKLLLLAIHVTFFKWSFLAGMKVNDIKAGPPTATTVLLYFQIMVS